MDTLSQILSTAISAHQAGELERAETLYLQILSQVPLHQDALHLLGIIYYQTGRHDQSVDMIRRAIASNPGIADFYMSLGTAYRLQGKLHEAVETFRQATVIRPDFPEAHFSHGVALATEKKFPEARIAFEKAISLRPDYAEAYNNLGVTLKNAGFLDQAEQPYRTAIALKPDYAEALNNLGNLLKAKGQQGEAEQCFVSALAAQGDNPETWNNLGTSLQSGNQYEAAEAAYRESLRLDPEYPDALYNLGTLLIELKRYTEAIDALIMALQLQPQFSHALEELLDAMQWICLWDEFKNLVSEMDRRLNEGDYSFNPFSLLALFDNPIHQKHCAEANAQRSIQSCPDPFIHPKHSPNKGVIRLGYLSYDYREHPLAFLISELFELHDRSRFQVFGYGYGPDDHSTTRERMTNTCDKFTDIAALSHRDAAKTIHDDGIDILIDLTGYTAGARGSILAPRPAPIQINWLGYPGTMGAPFMDYIIADSVLVPHGAESFYSEKIVRLPDCYQINDRQRPVAEITFSRSDHGLPDDAFVFCSFNHTHKIMPDLFNIWMDLLHAVPGSVLWLLESNSTAPENLRREASRHDIDPERIIFSPRMPLSEHLARYRLADLFLDTFPYTSHTTASDALWVGLPLVTCMGKTFAARVAGSLLNATGVPELITNNFDEYRELALKLATDPDLLSGVRRKLIENRDQCALFDTPRFVSNLESAYEMIMARRREGLEPADITVTQNQ